MRLPTHKYFCFLYAQIKQKNADFGRLQMAVSFGLALVATIFSGGVMAATITFPTVPLFISNSVAPNIMLMLDNSGSMQNVVPDSPYDASVTYLSSCPVANQIALGSFVDLMVENKATGTVPLICFPLGATCSLAVEYGTSPGKKCFNTNQQYSARLNADATRSYLLKNYFAPSGYLSTTYSGNYLNWYFSTTSVMGQNWNNGESKKPIGNGMLAQSRIEIVKSGAIGLISGLDSILRVGLSVYNPNQSATVTGLYGGKLLSAVSPLGASNSAKRTDVINKIDGIVAGGATPLASTLSDIGRYFTTGYTGNLTLYPDTAPVTRSVATLFNNHSISDPDNIGSQAPIVLSCQRSFAVLLTDGRPQFDQVISNDLADYDQDCTLANGCSSKFCAVGTNNASGCDKKSSRSYESLGSDYLDDVAKALREIDLRPDFLNEKTDGKQFINNIITYIIGFSDPAVQNDPLVKATGDAEHGGGGFIAATDASSLTEAFLKISNNIAKINGSASAASASTTRLEVGSKIYQAHFNSGDWSGDLRAFTISTGAGGGCPTVLIGLPCPNPLWSAAGQLDLQNFTATSAGARVILSYNSTERVGIPFRWASLNANQKSALNLNTNSTPFVADANGSLRVDYLRGDRSKEATAANPSFRVRSTVLGDIVNSDPLDVGPPNSAYGFNNYSVFRGLKSLRTPMVYVGANDGMVHGFKASDGKELLAYVPSKSIGDLAKPRLAQLTQRNYTHQFTADGTLTSGDALINGAWKSVLVGGMRSGGQGIFALDVTDPSTFSESNPATVLWEFTDADDPDLGYTFSKPYIVKMANGKWAAIISNGYNNTEPDANVSGNGKSALFIIYLDGPGASGWVKGTHYIKLVTSQGEVGSPNGLAPPAPVDINNDDIVDYIYAGDQLGNMWRFDVNVTSDSTWAVAYGNKPLFVAKAGVADTAARQPITVRPDVAFNSLRANSKSLTSPKLVLYFGTGQYIDATDNATTGQTTQSFYSIFDDFGVADPNITRANLLAQSITNQVNPSGSNCVDSDRKCFRITSDNTFASDGNLGGKRGWYIDLVVGVLPAANLGERQVTTPVLRNGHIVFTTLLPNSDPCGFGGGGFLMELDAKTGSRLASSPNDINDNGVISAEDNIAITNGSVTTNYAVSGIRSTVGILTSPTFINITNRTENKYISGSGGAVMVITGQTNVRSGRITWREVIL